ncbi:hypothetical protein ACIQ2D_13995 [Lysinibacillus sp. NPDC097287]|uniref:hypothetical protein n=1 Tax=Lysinibacillus sp. NPDC097287 TaxID=3364144 RepID=UPI0037F151C9
MNDKRYVKHMNWDNKCCQHTDKYEKKDDKVCKMVEVCWEKEDKGCNKEEKCHCRKENKCEKKHNNDCDGCICNQLRKLEAGTLVDIFLSSGVSFIGLVFISLDECNCCAHFLEVDAAGNVPLVVDCRKIDAIRRSVS